MDSESESPTKNVKTKTDKSTKTELQQQVVIHNIKQFFLKNLQICRICLETEDDSKGSARLIPISNAIWSFLELQDRTLPETICTKCQRKITNFISLMENFAESNEMLSKIREEIVFTNENEEKDELIAHSEDESMTENVLDPLVDDQNPKEESFKMLNDKFSCNFCEKLFDSRHSITNHIQNFHTRPEKCPVKGCSKSFGIPSLVRRHLQQVHTAQDLSLYIEGQEMIFKPGPSGKFSCIYCKEKFIKRYNLEKHIEKMHQKPHDPCKICGKVYDPIRMRVHLKIHRKIFECNECGKKFVDKFLLKQHLIALHLGKKVYLCSKCGQNFMTAQMLRRHVVKIHEKIDSSLSDEKKGICKHCGVRFSDQYALVQHVKTHILVHKCKICAKRFASEVTLKNHEKSHTQNEEFQFQCKTCDKRYETKANLKAHFDRFHVIREQWLCTYCHKRLPGRRALDVHEKSHEGIKDFGCFLCEKAFTSTQRLKAHLITNHTDSKYRCSVCTTTLWQTQRGFERHMQREHPDLFLAQPDMNKYFEKDEPKYTKLMERYQTHLKKLAIKRQRESCEKLNIEVLVVEVENE